jgi:hypothetical protein
MMRTRRAHGGCMHAQPPVARCFLVKELCCGQAAHHTHCLSYALFARHAGSRDANKATARTLMRALGKSFRRAPTPCDNHVQRESFSASSAPTCSEVTCDTMRCDPFYERMAAKNARVSGPMHLSLHSKLRSSALYGLVE